MSVSAVRFRGTPVNTMRRSSVASALFCAAVLAGCAGSPRPTPAAATATQAADTYDLIVRNGTIIDGQKTPRYQADVGVLGDRITAIGKHEVTVAVERHDPVERESPLDLFAERPDGRPVGTDERQTVVRQDTAQLAKVEDHVALARCKHGR